MNSRRSLRRPIKKSQRIPTKALAAILWLPHSVARTFNLEKKDDWI